MSTGLDQEFPPQGYADLLAAAKAQVQRSRVGAARQVNRLG